MFDFSAVMNIKNDFATLLANHPKLSPFIAGVKSKGCCVGQEIAIAIRYPDGTEYKTGIRLQESDLNIIKDIGALTKNS